MSKKNKYAVFIGNVFAHSDGFITSSAKNYCCNINMALPCFFKYTT
jgi:hypothetical protein